MRRRVIPLLLFGLVFSCGPGNSGIVDPGSFPAIAGDYLITADFEDHDSTAAGAAGSVIISQPTRRDSVLLGSSQLTLRMAGVTLDVVAFQNAYVTLFAKVHFEATPPARFTGWQFDGDIVEEGRIVGTHTLVDDELGVTYRGTFVATPAPK